jgi:uncharacterized membrane protein
MKIEKDDNLGVKAFFLGLTIGFLLTMVYGIIYPPFIPWSCMIHTFFGAFLGLLDSFLINNYSRKRKSFIDLKISITRHIGFWNLILSTLLYIFFFVTLLEPSDGSPEPSFGSVLFCFALGGVVSFISMFFTYKYIEPIETFEKKKIDSAT